jgi:diacylglycerol kinase family enzyme
MRIEFMMHSHTPACREIFCPEINPASPLQFVINGASGSADANTKREAIEAALRLAGRTAELRFSRPAELARLAKEAANKALATNSAVVAVGGDGTMNAVAQAAHSVGCAMGVVPQGTFNYFARMHGIASDVTQAVDQLLHAVPTPTRVAALNERVFLVNASLGLYPHLLEDREAYKARFGRSRWVALWAAAVTLLRAQRRLRLHIEQGGAARNVRTLTLFVGNNRLQLERLGVQPQASEGAHAAADALTENAWADSSGSALLTAVMLKPIGTLSMIGLMLRGAMGTLGEAQSVEHFEFKSMVVQPTLLPSRRGVKVAFDGEVVRMRAPLKFQMLDRPLHLMLPRADVASSAEDRHSAGRADGALG